MLGTQKDILFDANGELGVVNGDWMVGESELQEVERILTLNQGELKSDPVLGPSLVRKLKSRIRQSEIVQLVRIHLSRDKKNYDTIKNYINIKTGA